LAEQVNFEKIQFEAAVNPYFCHWYAIEIPLVYLISAMNEKILVNTIKIPLG
jgi:hypothetical protein